MAVVKQYIPDSMQDIVKQDVLKQIERMEKQGYALPENYDKFKNDLQANEMKLFEQQTACEKDRQRKKMEYYLKLGARAVHWSFSNFKIDCIRTAALPGLIRKAIADHEFDDSLEHSGDCLRDTILDHPLAVTFAKFLEKVGESNDTEAEKEVEEVRERRKHEGTLKNLNALREANVSRPIFKRPGVPSVLKRIEEKSASAEKPEEKPVEKPEEKGNEGAVGREDKGKEGATKREEAKKPAEKPKESAADKKK